MQFLALHPLERWATSPVHVDGQYSVDGKRLDLLGAKLRSEEASLLLSPSVVLPDICHGYGDHKGQDGFQETVVCLQCRKRGKKTCSSHKD